MALSENQGQTLKSDSTNACCYQWKKKYLKAQESRTALRQAVNVLELKINEIQAHNNEACGVKIQTEEKCNASDGNENESIQGFKACIADNEKEIGRLKELLETERRNADFERKKAAEACKLLDEEKKTESTHDFKACIDDREKEIGRLKELLEIEKRRADSERKKAAEACKLLEEEKKTESIQGFKACIADREKEIGRLKELLETEKRRADSENKKASEAFKLLEEEKKKTESIQGFKACIADREKEIGRLKELLETQKRRADSERKKAADACKLLEEEKKKASEKGMQISRIEAEKAEQYRIQISQLEKQVKEAKAKLVTEMSTFKEVTKRFEAEKRKILEGKRNAEIGMAKANENLEVEKHKASGEKRRADAVIAKLEEQKALADDNWNKFMNEKLLADKMSKQLEEDKKTIEDLKQKVHELSSQRESIEMAADISVKDGSTKVKLLKKQMKLEKLRAKHARQKYKLEASRHSVLQHELGRLKTDFIQLLHRLHILDGSFSPVAGNMHDQTKNSNVMRQVCNLNLSRIHSQYENELMEPCCTTLDACDPLRTNMQHTALLALSGGNYSESIAGIDSKLEPLVRGSDRTKLQSSAVNSSTEYFSDGQLMGSQETTTFPVTASTKLTQEIVNARQSKCNPSDKSATVPHMKSKRIHDMVEFIANLSSENLSDLQSLLCGKTDKCLGGREMLHNLNNLQEKNKTVCKKRKKSHREKMDMIPSINRDEKKGSEEAEAEVYNDANVCKLTSCPTSFTLETTQACGEMICDAANNFETEICFDEVADGSFVKLLELEDATLEERYIKAMEFPVSPSLPEIEFCETLDVDDLKNPCIEKALQEDLLNSKTDLLPSPPFDVVNLEIDSSEQKVDVSGVSFSSQNKSTQARKSEAVNLQKMQTPANSSTVFLVEGGIGSSHNQLPKFCVVFSKTEDISIISRILVAAKNCIAQCNLATQTGWAVSDILTALKMEEKLSQKEKVSVLLTLLLFNFIEATTMTFGKLWDGNLSQCLNSYSEHIHTVMYNAETRILFLENYSLNELLGLTEDFLIEGKVVVNNIVHSETSSDCDLRSNDFLDCVKEVSSDVASNEQLVAGSIILASLCAATGHFGFLCEISCDIVRLCKWDSLVVLTILHIFAYLGGEKLFKSDNFGLMATVLKSLVMFLEGRSLSVATASCLPSINQLHTEFYKSVECPFLDGAESIDLVACLLVEEIKNCCLQGIKLVDMSDSRFMSDNYNAGQCFHQEMVHCTANKSCDASCCLKKCLIFASQPDALQNPVCHLSDVLSLVELVANTMSWQWTDIKLVPQLLNMLDSNVEGSFGIPIIVLLGQLGRIGVHVGGYDDQRVQSLRNNLLSYLCSTSSMNAAGLPLQIATATAVFGLLPLDFETLFTTNFNHPEYSRSVSDNAETLRKWFCGLDKDEQDLLSGILKMHCCI